MRSLVIAAVVLVGCGSELEAEDVATSREALSTPFLLELNGVSAGFVTTVTSASGGSACNSTSLRFTLGPNMSAAARGWLNSVYLHQGPKQSGAIYIAGQNVKVAFSGATVSRVDAPLVQSGDASEVFFTITQGGAATTCTSVSANVMAQKNQSAAAWAVRRALAKNAIVSIGGTNLSPPMRAVHTSYGNLKIGDFKVEFGTSDASAMLAWVQSLLDKGVIEDSEYAPSLVLRDENGNPINVLRLYGPAAVTNSNGQSVSAQIDYSRLYTP